MTKNDKKWQKVTKSDKKKWQNMTKNEKIAKVVNQEQKQQLIAF